MDWSPRNKQPHVTNLGKCSEMQISEKQSLILSNRNYRSHYLSFGAFILQQVTKTITKLCRPASSENIINRKSNQAILNKRSPHWSRLCAVQHSISNSSEWLSWYIVFKGSRQSFIPLLSSSTFCFTTIMLQKWSVLPKWVALIWMLPPVSRRLQYRVCQEIDVNNEVLHEGQHTSFYLYVKTKQQKTYSLCYNDNNTLRNN